MTCKYSGNAPAAYAAGQERRKVLLPAYSCQRLVALPVAWHCPEKAEAGHIPVNRRSATWQIPLSWKSSPTTFDPGAISVRSVLKS
jgi:hypothetical protein